MITLRCTKKLQQHLGVKHVSGDVEPTSALGDWYGNLVLMPRGRSLVLICNERSMLAVVLRPDADVLTEFRRRAMALLHRLEIPAPAVEKESFHIRQIRIGKTQNRRVLGSMNDAAVQIEARLFVNPRGPVATLEHLEDVLAGNLYSMLDYEPPADVARELMGAPPGPWFFRSLVAAPGNEAPPLQEQSTPRPAVREAKPKAKRFLSSTREPKALQFKITLKRSKPPIWRRIVVPDNYSFWDLHVAIQDAMGWFDGHLHEFRVTRPGARRESLIGIPEEESWSGMETVPGWKVAAASVFRAPKTKCSYVYDFGDDWKHVVLLEKVLSRDPDMALPACTGGRRRCPPEDCGGPWGYELLLEILADPDHPEYAERMDWAGGPIDPAEFDPKEVVFDDPGERLSYLLEDT